MITVEVSTSRIRVITRQLKNPRGLNAALGGAYLAQLQAHFTERDGEPNKRGWAKGHFWGQIRQATALGAISEKSATIRVADRRLALHLYGGTVRPREKKALAIPIHPMAYGLRAGKPGDNSSGFSSFTATTGIALFRIKKKDGGSPRVLYGIDDGGGLVAFYALATSAKIPKDPRALPPRDEVRGNLIGAARRYLDRKGDAA